MKTDLKVDGVMILTVVAVAAAAFVAYKLKSVAGAVGQKISDIVDIPVHAFNFVNNAVPSGITFDKVLADGTTTPITVSGEQIKQANANGANMGMIAWPTSSTPNVSANSGKNWWGGVTPDPDYGLTQILNDGDGKGRWYDGSTGW